MDKSVDLIPGENSADLYAQRICTSCGLCCDGSLFKRARIFADEDAALFESLDLQLIFLKDGRRSFLLPCHHLQGSICSIYGNVRPGICSDFRCKLLRSFYAGDILYEAACEVVRNAVEHVRKVKTDLTHDGISESGSLDELFISWKKSCGTENAAIELNYQSLQFRLERDFRVKKDK